MTHIKEKLDFRSPRESGRTEIRIGAGAIVEALQELVPWFSGRTVFLVSPGTIRGLHGDALGDLYDRATEVVELDVPDGEAAKTIEVAERLWEEMLDEGGKRSSRLVTFGGGSVGDLGGFVAGCFLRGIEYCHIPTTLLAQVDAAIGGKTAVDLPGGKNTVGLFHHPAWVISDTAVLGTLPKEELRSGLVEVVKMAALLDPPLLDRVESSLDTLVDGDADALAPVVAAAAAAKCRVVEEDAEEAGLRKVLNYGHTLGHAIEGVLGYSGLRHGEAVAYGMLFAIRLAERRGLVREHGERLERLFERFELPELPKLEPEALWAFMTRDKKATEAGISWVLPTSPDGVPFGHYEFTTDVDRAVVLEVLEAFLGDPWRS